MNLRNLWRRMLQILSALTVIDHDVARPAGRLVLFSCHDVDRSMNVNGLRFSPLLEGIRQLLSELGYVFINLTNPQALFDSSHIRGGSITLNYRALLGRLRALWYLMLNRDDNRRFALEWETQMYRNLLLDLDPDLIISIQPPPALCRAARSIGLKVIEAMHGTHYSLNDKIFAAHMKNPDELLPNVLLSFDDVSHATLDTLCVGRDIVAEKANDPWLHSVRLAQVRSPSAQTPFNGALVSADKCVLVTLQWGYDGERASLSNIIPNGILHPALEAAFIALAASGVRFLVRMHPIQMNGAGYWRHRRYVNSLASRYSNVEYQDASTRPLPVLLEEVCAHVTMSSSTVGEAAAMHVPSLMLCPTLHAGGVHEGFFRELEDTGLVTFGKLETDAIVAWIKACPPREHGSMQAYDAERQHAAELSFYTALIERVKADTGNLASDELATVREIS